MLKHHNSVRIMIIMLITSLLLAGCVEGKPWDDDKATNNFSFGFSVKDYYEKGSIIPDNIKIDDKINVFITNGNKDMNHNPNNKYEAEKVRISAIDMDSGLVYDLTTIDIRDNYATLNIRDIVKKLLEGEQIESDQLLEGSKRIKLRAEGKIIHVGNDKGNLNYWNGRVGYSNEFTISIDEFSEIVESNSEVGNLKITPEKWQLYTTGSSNHNSIAFKAIAIINGKEEDVSNHSEITWQSSNVAVATMEGNIAKAKSYGMCKVVATFRGEVASADLFVRPQGAAYNFRIEPGKKSISVGDSFPYKAYIKYNSGLEFDVTNFVRWTVEDKNKDKAAISESGVVTALAAGKGIVIEAFIDKNQGNSGDEKATATLDIEVSNSSQDPDPSPEPPIENPPFIPSNENLIWEREVLEDE